MKEGIIVNGDDVATLWEYCVKEKLWLKGDFKERKFLLTEKPSNPNDNFKGFIQKFFILFYYYNNKIFFQCRIFNNSDNIIGHSTNSCCSLYKIWNK